jgi:heme exporter protein C
MSRRSLYRYASPPRFERLAARLTPWFAAAAVLLIASGIFIGLAIAPADALQRDIYRIMFVHVPASWMSMFIFVVMAAYCALHLALNARLAPMMALALAPTGALFTALSLITGALWGKPTWGTWWVWDARLTSELILLFLYAGFLSLHAAIDGTQRADRACCVLALVGVVNIPVIYFSVQWWYTLHQGPSMSFGSGVSMSASMVWGIVVTAAGFWAYTAAVALTRVRTIMRMRMRSGIDNAVTTLEERAA